MTECAKCGKNLGAFSKKCYIYPGKEKCSFEITDEKIVCENCLLPKADEDFEKKKADAGVSMVQNMMEGNYGECLKILESYFDKENPADWYTKGNLLWSLKKTKEALKCYDEALFLDTHYVKAWYRKGLSLLRSGKYDDAEKCFMNVIKLEVKEVGKGKLIVDGKPNLWTLAAMLDIAVTFEKQEKFKEAHAFYTWVSGIISDLPPFEYCLRNLDQVLKFLEPSAVAEVRLYGQKH